MSWTTLGSRDTGSCVLLVRPKDVANPLPEQGLPKGARKEEGKWMPARQLALHTTLGTGEEVREELFRAFVWDLEFPTQEGRALHKATGSRHRFTIGERD